MALLRQAPATALALLVAALIAAGHLLFHHNIFNHLTDAVLRLDATGLDELVIPLLLVFIGCYIDLNRARRRERQESAINRVRLATLYRLAGSVAHHIRTPLAVIQNSIHFLEHSLPPDAKDVPEVLAEMKRAVSNSDHIITEMLEYVRDPPANAMAFPIGNAIARALKLAPIPESVHLRELTGEVDQIKVHANQDQVIHILVNLVLNAVQAMPEGGELEVGACREDDGLVCVRVRDTGCGIPEGNLHKIFEPLFSTKMIGIGLGLPIAQRYAQLNGGDLSVESKVGQGTTCRLLLRAAS